MGASTAFTLPMLQIILTSSVCAAIVTQALIQLKAFLDTREASKFAALYAAVSLDRFAAICLGYASSPDRIGTISPPRFSDLRQEIELKAIGLDVAHRLMVIELDALYIHDVSWADVSENHRIDYVLRAITLGQKAIETARLIRKKFNIQSNMSLGALDTEAGLANLVEQLSTST